MKLSQNQQEKLILAIQGVLGLLIIGLSVRSSSRAQSAQMKKFSQKSAKNLARLQRDEYKWKHRLLRQTYRNRLLFAKELNRLLADLKVRKASLRKSPGKH